MHDYFFICVHLCGSVSPLLFFEKSSLAPVDSSTHALANELPS